MFFNQPIELSKTRESERRRLLEGKTAESLGRIGQQTRALIEEQSEAAVRESTRLDIGYRKPRGRVLFEQKMDRYHRIENSTKDLLAQAIGGIVAESLWMDDTDVERFRLSVESTAAGLVAGMFDRGELSLRAFSGNRAVAVRCLYEDAAADAALAEATADAKFRDPNKADTAEPQDDTVPKDGNEAGTKRRKQAEKAASAIVSQVREYVKKTIAAEKDIADRNAAAEAEVKNESRLVRPRRESPTLWRSINVGVARVLSEEGDADIDKVLAESMAVYTFMETLNVMNLVRPSATQVSSICSRLAEAKSAGQTDTTIVSAKGTDPLKCKKAGEDGRDTADLDELKGKAKEDSASAKVSMAAEGGAALDVSTTDPMKKAGAGEDGRVTVDNSVLRGKTKEDSDRAKKSLGEAGAAIDVKATDPMKKTSAGEDGRKTVDNSVLRGKVKGEDVANAKISMTAETFVELLGENAKGSLQSRIEALEQQEMTEKDPSKKKGIQDKLVELRHALKSAKAIKE